MLCRGAIPHDPVGVVLFAGGGGSCEGFRLATGRSPDVAVDHNAAAIQMHKANHPGTQHHHSDVYAVKPYRPRGRRPTLLWLSPECQGHSRAKTGPVDKESRALADSCLPWAREVRPSIIMLEEVPPWLDWGPLYPADHPDPKRRNRPIPERKGEYFRAWCAKLEAEGYVIEWRRLIAADYGAPTTRVRLFLVARCDGQPIVWPEPTHGPGRLPYRTAAECIDWTIPCPSIFLTKAEVKSQGLRCRRPLAPKTLARIAAGVQRHALESAEPFLMHLSEPIGQRQALAAAFLEHHNGKATPIARRATTGRFAVVLCKYYGADRHGQSIREPLHTIPTTDRFGLVIAHIDDAGNVTDIGMRMLQPRELATAQGFGPEYILTGTKTEQVGRIGNSVSPHPARALIEAQLYGGSRQGQLGLFVGAA